MDIARTLGSGTTREVRISLADAGLLITLLEGVPPEMGRLEKPLTEIPSREGVETRLVSQVGGGTQELLSVANPTLTDRRRAGLAESRVSSEGAGNYAKARVNCAAGWKTRQCTG